MGHWTQDDRPIGVETPLGKDKLVLTSFKGEEQMSGLFAFSLTMLSEDGGVQANDIVGQSVDFFVRHPDDEQRYFNGIVNQFSYSGKGDRGHLYRAHVVPWLWLLTRGSDCRVHEFDKKQDAKDIIDGLLGDLGFSDYQWKLKRKLEKRQYCVQYRETHFDFMCRLLEEEGIGYYFKHEKGKHDLILTDHVDGAYVVKDSEVNLLTNLAISEVGDNLTAWSKDHEYTSGKWTINDYNFEKPSTSLLTDTKSLVSLPKNSNLEFYDFPGDYTEKGLGNALVRLRMEEEETSHESVTGSSCCRSFSPGGRFQVKKHNIKEEEGNKWVLTAVQHQANFGGNYVTGGEHSDEIYQNSFRCIPSTVVYRPVRERSKPRVMGMHTAEVVGPSGEEIHTDKHGRIKVQFPWDRIGKKDENSSLWVRVSTAWAGKQWGMVHIPRIGQEVLISFLEGDPDRPVVTGMLYNAEHMPPYSLPDNKTQSGIKSHSTKNGGDDNFNELRFEDKKGEEEIYFHAEKDFNRVVENDDTLKVGFDDKDPGDQTVEIFNNQDVTIGCAQAKDGSQTTEIFNNQDVTIGCAQAKDGSQTTEIWKDQSLTLKQGNQTTKLDLGSQTTEICKDQSTTLKQGNQTTKLNSGKASTEAMQSIELKVGSNSILIDQTGITIKGLMVTVQADTQAVVKSPLTDVKGDATLTLKGGMTMIN